MNTKGIREYRLGHNEKNGVLAIPVTGCIDVADCFICWKNHANIAAFIAAYKDGNKANNREEEELKKNLNLTNHCRALCSKQLFLLYGLKNNNNTMYTVNGSGQYITLKLQTNPQT